MVLIDDTTMSVVGAEPYAMRWPLPRVVFAELIAELHLAGAKNIVMDFTFIEHGETQELDLMLAAMSAAIPGVVWARTEKNSTVFWDDAYRREHAAFFASPREGLVELNPDSDSIKRSYEARNSLAAVALGQAGRNDTGLIRWAGNTRQLRERGLPVISAHHFFSNLMPEILPVMNLLDKEFPDRPAPEQYARFLATQPALTGGAYDVVRGKTVFVGASAHGTFDLKSLPVGQLEPGTLVQLTAWANLATTGLIHPIARSWSLLVALIASAGFLTLSARRPGIGLPGLLTVFYGLLVIGGAYAAISYGWFFSPATPVFSAVITLLALTAENVWAEQRRKREIQAMFGSYVDPGVVEQLVRDPNAIRLGGEKREGTVFFSDLAGFTDLSEKLPPDQLMTVVNLYLQEVSECLLDHGAYIDKYIGDAVMAVFGAPAPRENADGDACAGALAALGVLKSINARIQATHGITLAMRIGINSGPLILGNLGSERKKNYTVLGDCVNLASRLEGANKEFGTTILLGENTARNVAGIFATRPLTRLRVKGKQQAVEVHELIGRPAELSPQQNAFLTPYLKGYASYESRQFATAADFFAQALTAHPTDKVTRALHEAALAYSLQPPPADWEPILTLDSK